MTSYKTCAVPMCRNTTIKCPGKLFICVPMCPKRRKQWIQLARRDPKRTSAKTPIFFCENHFDLPKDMENYIQYRIMGSVGRIRMKPDCFPSKFECQPDRIKRTAPLQSRSAVRKRRRMDIIQEIMSKETELPTSSSLTSNSDIPMDHEIEQIYVKPDISHLKVEVDCEQDQSGDLYQSPEQVFNIKRENTPGIESYENSISDDYEGPKSKESIEIIGKVYENGKINRLQCPQCDNTFKNRANLKQHLKFVHSSEDDIVECDKCYRTFKSVGHLRSHMHSIHAEEKEVTCEHCGKVFPNKKRLNNHIFYSHPEPEESVNCNVCAKAFKRRYNLKIHMRLVHPSEDRSVQCPHCDKKFKVDMLLQRHIKWSHPQDGMMYRCPQCGRTLPSIACFRKHMQNVHSESQDAVCNICSKVFKTVKTLKRHQKNIHGGGKVEVKQYKIGDLPCSQCDKKFTTNTALFWHFERHHSENKRSNACQICGKELSDQGSLKRHLEMVHTVEPASCHICAKTFKSPMNLQRHIRVTHAPPEAAQKCDICDKTFKCSMHLRIHVNAVHSTEGIFNCDICNKEFSSKKYMLKHRKTHVDVKEFPCGICNKFFKCINDVKKHAKRVHMKSPIKTEAPDYADEAPKNTENAPKSVDSLNCFKCGRDFVNDVELHAHILNCNDIEVTSFIKVEIEEE